MQGNVSGLWQKLFWYDQCSAFFLHRRFAFISLSRSIIRLFKVSSEISFVSGLNMGDSFNFQEKVGKAEDRGQKNEEIELVFEGCDLTMLVEYQNIGSRIQIIG